MILENNIAWTCI